MFTEIKASFFHDLLMGLFRLDDKLFYKIIDAIAYALLFFETGEFLGGLKQGLKGAGVDIGKVFLFWLEFLFDLILLVAYVFIF